MLVKLVIKEGYSLASAVKQLRLKLSTARFILQKYKQHGTFPMKKFKKSGRMFRDLSEEPQEIEPLPSMEVKP